MDQYPALISALEFVALTLISSLALAVYFVHRTHDNKNHNKEHKK